MPRKDPASQSRPENAGRRRVLQGAMAGAVALSLTPASSRAAPAGASATAPYDAIVIGGGFAGVVAARDLSLRGNRTLLLEARPRLGGRTFTTTFAGHDLDVGGTWFGSSQPFVWSEMMRYGVGFTESAAARAERAVWMNGEQRVTGDPGIYAGIYEQAALKFYEPTRAVLPRPYDPLFLADSGGLDRIDAETAIRRLDLTPVQRDLLLSFCAINGHSFARESSYLDQLRWFALGNYDLWNLWDNLSKYRFVGGTKTLLDCIQGDSRAELRTGTPVASVSQSQDGVEVRSRGGESWRARQLIVAVPLNCIADIAFEPAISTIKLETSRRRHTGSGTKVYVKTRRKHPVFMGHGRQEMPLCFVWTEYDDPQAQVLCGFGASPELLDINDDRAVQAAVQHYLPEAEVDSSFGYDWNLDPYSKGTWCMYRPGTLTGALRELQRPEGRIHFAGADVANGWRGFIDGAIESGASVARQVAEQLVKGA